MRSLILFILFGGISLHAQNIGFQKIHNRSNHLFPDFLQLSYESYVANVHHNNYQYLELTRLDYFGNVSGQITLDSISSTYLNPHYIPCDNCLQIKGEKLFYAYGETDQAAIQGNFPLILASFHKDLSDTIRTHRIHIPGQRSIIPLGLRFDTDSTFFLAAWTSTVQNEQSAYFAKFEDNFQLIWDTLLPRASFRNAYDAPLGILIDPYGYALVSGGYSGRDSAAASITRFALDSGNIDWHINYNAPDSVGNIYAAMRNDGNYQLIKEIRTENHVILMETAVMDTNGQIVNSERFGIPNRHLKLSGLIPSKDGNFYAAGDFYYGRSKPFGFKFSPQLDSLWIRPYWYRDTTFNDIRINKIAQRPDSLFIHAASIFTYPFNTDSTLFVFTSNREGYNSYNQSIISKPEFRKGNWQLYPNPSRGTLLLESDYNGPVLIAISDAGGKLIYEKELSTVQKISINTGLKPGIYWLEMHSPEGQVLFQRKLMIY